jgi:serine/threonine-protein phosphatase 4 regulatory subunit 1
VGDGAQITPSLLGHFIALGQFEHDDKTDGSEPDLAVFAAFSFPGVLQTLGAARWAELHPLFNSLSRDSQKKVRIPLSHSLHEVLFFSCQPLIAR